MSILKGLSLWIFGACLLPGLLWGGEDLPDSLQPDMQENKPQIKAVLQQTSVTGFVQRMSRGESVWNVFQTQQKLLPGDRIRLGSQSSLQIKYGEDLLVWVSDSSEFWIQKQGNSNQGLDVEFLVQKGMFYVQMHEPVSIQDRQSIKLVHGLAVQKSNFGTFIANFQNKNISSEVHVLKGYVELQSLPANLKRVVKGGESYTYAPIEKEWRYEELNLSLLLYNYKWLDSLTLKKEQIAGWNYTKRQQDILSGKALARVLVNDFQGRVKAPEHWKVEKTLADLVARELRDLTYREVIRGGQSDGSILAQARQFDADRVVQGDLKKFFVEKKAVYDKTKKKWVTRYSFEFHLILSIYDGLNAKVIRTRSFEARSPPSLDNSSPIDSLWVSPLVLNNTLILDSPIGKTLQALKKQMHKFGMYAL